MPILTPRRQSRKFRNRRTGTGDSSRAVSGNGVVSQRRRKTVGRRRPDTAFRRLVLTALLGVGLLLLTLAYRNDSGGVLSNAQMHVLNAVAPLERGLTRAWDPIGGAYEWSRTLLRATGENPKLHKEIDQLQAKVMQAEVIEQENERLRDIVALNERGRFPEGFEQRYANVIARSPTAIDDSIIIDVGSSEGVTVDSPVMVPSGLLGRVTAVTRHSAKVALIINKAEAVSAMDATTSASGIIRPVSTDGSPVMELAYVTQRAKVSVGDVIVTSGWSRNELSSRYPRGIPIGIVSSVGNSPADLYKTVQVSAFADFDRLIEVVVLVPRPGVRDPRESVGSNLTPDARQKSRRARGTRAAGRDGAH